MTESNDSGDLIAHGDRDFDGRQGLQAAWGLRHERDENSQDFGFHRDPEASGLI